jgi:hypothetical protein
VLGARLSALRARIEAAAVRFAEEIVSAIEVHTGSTEWVDQYASPLGKRRHLEAVRRGDLNGSKDGRRVLVRRADVDEYIRRKAIVNASSDTDDVDQILVKVGLRPEKRRAV